MKLLCVASFFALSGCSWVSYIHSRQVLSLSEIAPITAVTQNKINQAVPIDVSGGIPPYTLEVISGTATVDSVAKTITTLIAGTVSVRITDSAGNVKTVDFVFSGNQTVQPGVSIVFKVTADFAKVFYTKADGSGNEELYSSNSDGTSETKLVASGTVVGSYTFKSIILSTSAIELTPNEQYVVFLATDQLSVTRLYIVKTDGTGLIQLSADYTNTLQRVRSFKILSNTKVSYRDAEQEDSGDPEPWMRVVNIDGSGRQLIHPDFGNNGDANQVLNFTYSTDLTKVFHFSEVSPNIWTGLYVSNTDGSSNGAFLRISPHAVDFSSGQTSAVPITPDGTRVMVTTLANIYFCNVDGSGCPISYAGFYSGGEFSYDNNYFLVTGLGTKYLFNTSLNQSVNLGSSTLTYKLVSGSNFVYQTATFASGGTISRTALTTAGAASWTQISPAFPGFSNITSMTISNDFQKIYFLVDDQNDYIYRLYRMNLDGSAAEAIANVTFDMTGSTGTIPAINKISANQERALIVVGNDLHMVNLNSGGSTKLTDRTQTTSTVSSISVFDDVRKVYYRSNQNSLSTTELFRVLSPD